MTNEELVKAYRKSKSETILLELIEKNMGLIASIARKYKASSYSIEDSLQDGICGLIKSIETYDPSKAKFTTYVYWNIYKAIQEGRPEGHDGWGEYVRTQSLKNPEMNLDALQKNIVHKTSRKITKWNLLRHLRRFHHDMRLDAPLRLIYSDREHSKHERAMDKALQREDSLHWQHQSDIHTMLKNLKPEDQELLWLYANDQTLDTMAATRKCSRENVRHILRGLLAKLHKKYAKD